MKVAYSQLRQLRACKDQLAEFKTRYGQEVEITEAGCLEVASVFDWDWAAPRLLPEATLAEYQRVQAPALAEYKRVQALAWAAYGATAAWAEYERVRAPAWAEYERAKAAAFAKAALLA